MCSPSPRSRRRSSVWRERFTTLSDLRLPDGDGIALLHWMKSQCPTVPVILMTGYAEIQSAVLAMKSGAADYIAKPLNPEELLNKINESLASNAESVVSQASSSSLPEPNLYIEGQSAAARVLYEHVRLVAPTDMSVLVTGASGTGKSMLPDAFMRRVVAPRLLL